jgi:hypothetical protein
MERLLRHVSAVDFFKLYKEELNLSALVLRRDSKSRELEGLKILEPEIAGSLPEQMQIDVDLGKVLQFSVNMQSGQKGGFFLDQRRNVAWLRDFLKNVKFSGSVKVLDSFCYCGQWVLRAWSFSASIYSTAGRGNMRVSTTWNIFWTVTVFQGFRLCITGVISTRRLKAFWSWLRGFTKAHKTIVKAWCCAPTMMNDGVICWVDG